MRPTVCSRRRSGRETGAHRGVLWGAAAFAACALLVFSAFLNAKQKKVVRVVTGEVVDQQDRSLVGAVVEMTDVQTGKKQAMYTQEGGHYEFSGLNRNHDYQLQAKYKGLTSDVRTASSFDTRDRIVLNLVIPPPKS